MTAGFEPNEPLPPRRVVGSSVGHEHTYLVTASHKLKMHTWAATTMFSNWLEGRPNGDRQTWLITVFNQDSQRFLEACKLVGVTVEEIVKPDGAETYVLVLGEPGTGWAN